MLNDGTVLCCNTFEENEDDFALNLLTLRNLNFTRTRLFHLTKCLIKQTNFFNDESTNASQSRRYNLRGTSGRASY